MSATSETKKAIVLDYRSLVSNPDCLKELDGVDIYLPKSIWSHLEALSNDDGDLGRNVEEVVKIFRKMERSHDEGDFEVGKLPDGKNLFIAKHEFYDQEGISEDLLSFAKNLKSELAKKSATCDVLIATSHKILIARAQLSDLKYQKLSTYRASHRGWHQLKVSDAVFARLLSRQDGLAKNGKEDFQYDLSLLEQAQFSNELTDLRAKLQNNDYILIKPFNDGYGEEVIASYRDDCLLIGMNWQQHHDKINSSKSNGLSKLGKIEPKHDQKCYYNSLFVPEDQDRLVICTGEAGSGKTLLALSAGLQQVRTGRVDEVVYVRNSVVVGESIGYLPGDEAEKTRWLLEPLMNNLAVLIGESAMRKISELDPSTLKTELSRTYHTTIKNLGYVRGETMRRKFIIVDEAQNMNSEQVKTILTRGDNSSIIVLLGDTTQSDLRHLSYGRSGLSRAVSVLRGQEAVFCFELRKSERGRICDIVSKLM